jgi:hypothetical protein
MFGCVYFSKKCNYCYDLMKLMENHGLTNFFKYESIDGMDPVQLTQLQLSEVPTLALIRNNNGKKQVEIKEGKAAFEWVKQYLIDRREMAKKNAETSRKLIQSDNIKNSLKEGLYDYCPGEQEGISDSYALCREDVDMALPKSFVNHDLSGQSIMTIPIGDIKNYKKKESIDAIYGKDTKKLISQLEDTRKKQDQQLHSVVEQNMISTVMNTTPQM